MKDTKNGDKPTILVTNDDGIDAPGLQALVRVLVSTNLYQVWVCAPDSGYGSSGEPSWRRMFLDVWGDTFFNSVTFYGRDLYALREDGGFDVFREMGRENHAWWRDVAKAPTSCCTSLPQCFHLRCDQHILRVIVGKFGESVEVFATDLQKWLKVVDLRKHMIFISGASSVCLDAKTPQMANKIYFPSSPIMYYSLETCRFHTLNNEDSFGDFFGTKHHLSPHGWIEPRWY
ncbi:Toll/interleukin-1 receptor domain-containing protein [Tanacetum coccineum]